MLSVKRMIFRAFFKELLLTLVCMGTSLTFAGGEWREIPDCERLLLSNASIPLPISKLNHQEFGDPTKPALVLIHGLDSAWQTFSNVIEDLSQDYYVIAYDQRGHGQSAEGGPTFFSGIMARDLLALLDHLGVAQAHILGHSMGARTATRFAFMFPDRVRSLIVEDMEMRNRSVYDRNHAARVLAKVQRQSQIPRLFPNEASLLETLTQEYGRERAEFMMKRKVTAHTDGTFELTMRPAVSTLYGWQANMEDLRPAFNGITAPTLVLQANPDDTAMSEEGVAEMRSGRPDADFVYLEDAGHTMHRTDEAGFLNALKTFLAKVEATQP